MKLVLFVLRRLALTITLSTLLAGNNFAQQPQKTASDDVIRVNTDLVQSAISVFDKEGRFVDGLRQDQFELLVDGKPRPISFFEQITAGSAREREVIAPDRSAADKITRANSSAQGRTVVFFIDDLHLDPDSSHRTRDMLRHFIDNEMGSADSVAIASASGQIGFLQQFTGNKEVLKAAVDRLSPIPYDVRSYGTGSTKMSEYMALDIDTHKSDDKVLSAFVSECMKQTNNFMKSQQALALLKATCETQVKESARAVLLQSGNITRNMYESFDSLLKSTSRMPGRKLAFFVSDGFLMDVGPHGAELRDRLDHIIDAAQRTGVVVYTIHAKGLVTSFPDASVKQPVDERIDMAKVGEVQAYQDALNALADDTGGRALRGTNYFDRWVGKMLDETSNYYLIAWRPENDVEKAAHFRHVKINVIGHPELVARAPRGYVEGPTPAPIAAAAKAPANHTLGTAESALRDALADYYPNRSLPTLLSLMYLNTPKNEMLLTSSIEISTGGLSYGNDGKQKAMVKLAGVILNDKGKIAASFKNQLNVDPLAGQTESAGVIYNEHTVLAPGIYQVRVASRDENSGRVGSAIQWIVIPDLATRQLHLSSVLFVAQVLGSSTSKDASPTVQFIVDRRFPQSSVLNYWILIYNAKRDASGTPNLSVKSEVWGNGRLITAAPARTIKNAQEDPDRIPFAEKIPLAKFARGHYELVVTITDNLGATSATQTIDFEVS